ncbi:hypothetical protein LTR95_014416 [Oleoguttula sp. CCFEE 5521]
MGKGKNAKGAVSKHSQARIDHLQRIAQYLTKQALSVDDNAPFCPNDDASPPENTSNGIVSTFGKDDLPTAGGQDSRLQDPVIAATASIPSYTFPGLPNLYTSHLTSIARKTQIRLPPQLKHCICKRCSSPLLLGLTSISRIENQSRGSSKPWADVQVMECLKCGAVRRVPVGAKRQVGKANREKTNVMGGVEGIEGKVRKERKNEGTVVVSEVE